MTAKGELDVSSTPQKMEETGLHAMRMVFRKTFRGALSGTSVAEMLGLMNQELGSGGYVALERFTGTLEGRSGSFCLQHSSTMTRGKPAQGISVVPDSGVDGLAGIAGSMTIEIVDGKHFYVFDYALGDGDASQPRG
jgi:hypothetical protein